MDISLTAARTLDFGIAHSICSIPEIFDCISEDGVEDYFPNVVNEFWILMVTESDEIAGCYRLHQVSSRTYEIHAFMIPEYRAKYSQISSRVILEWCLSELDFSKLIANIPQKYKNVYHFTKNTGFKDEGFNRSSFMKDGKLIGQYRLGITRDEIIKSLGVV